MSAVGSVSLGNNVVLEMVEIGGGTFTMGSPERGGVVSQVQLDGFHIGMTPVTQEQYETVMGTNPSTCKGRQIPVVQVTWEDAAAFCQAVSAQTGKNFTLPTEAQWEYACRAGSTSRFYFGDREEDLSDYGWYCENSRGEPQPVAQKTPNAFGLYDMHGNVWEWCADWYAQGYRPEPEARNPQGPPAGTGRLRKGGSWLCDAWRCCSSARSVDPGNIDPYVVGFRVVCLP